jgi:hypothetical protein
MLIESLFDLSVKGIVMVSNDYSEYGSCNLIHISNFTYFTATSAQINHKMSKNPRNLPITSFAPLTLT